MKPNIIYINECNVCTEHVLAHTHEGGHAQIQTGAREVRLDKCTGTETNTLTHTLTQSWVAALARETVGGVTGCSTICVFSSASVL